jgi:CheY-like chemotaxis protein
MALKAMNDRQPLVLVAEDRDEDIFIIRRAFRQMGFETPVQYVRDGDETIAYLAGERHFANREEYPLPAILLLDLKMPRRNGFDVLEWIQGQPTLKELRTVVLTTSDDLREVSRAYQLGAASFITKPLNFTEFKDSIVAIYTYWLAMNKSSPFTRPHKASTDPSPNAGLATQ